MKITADQVKTLREKTGLSVMECKKALEETGGNLDQAMEHLKALGLQMVEKKAARQTPEGKIGAYIHTNGRIGVLIEVNCETDFVARTEDFQTLVKNLCLQIAATSPSWIDRDAVPQEVLTEQRRIFQQTMSEKNATDMEKIINAKMEEFYQQHVLLEQKFIRDESLTIKDLLSQKVAQLGENIRVKRFVRFALGE
ncbi:MAG: elongation factor Ts [Candidatus Omnitrophica bacterium]|nr:elongation factor Ts [Candidatus Omnitrophota bacterium]